MKNRIDYRDTTLANAYSFSTAKIGLALAPKDTPLQYFLPFLIEDGEKENKVTLETAKEFLAGVRAGVISNKLVSAFGPYIDSIYKLCQSTI